jgi:4-coumarate--CoA ligase
LEHLLNTHPQINEAVVVGIPQPGRPENDIPFAYVVRRSKSLSEKEVMDFVAANVSDFKHLRGGVAFVDGFEKVRPTRLKLTLESYG